MCLLRMDPICFLAHLDELLWIDCGRIGSLLASMLSELPTERIWDLALNRVMVFCS